MAEGEDMKILCPLGIESLKNKKTLEERLKIASRYPIENFSTNIDEIKTKGVVDIDRAWERIKLSDIDYCTLYLMYGLDSTLKSYRPSNKKGLREMRKETVKRLRPLSNKLQSKIDENEKKLSMNI